MKITLDIEDGLFIRAERVAQQRGVTLDALAEEGLRHALQAHLIGGLLGAIGQADCAPLPKRRMRKMGRDISVCRAGHRQAIARDAHGDGRVEHICQRVGAEQERATRPRQRALPQDIDPRQIGQNRI